MASKRFPIAAGQTPSIVGGPRGPEAYRAELNAMRSGGASAAASTLIDYPDLTRPWSTIAPPRSLAPGSGGPIWRDSMNVMPRDGLMRRRPGIVAWAPGGPTPALTAGTNNELPVWIYNYVSPLDQTLTTTATGGCFYGLFSQPASLTVLVTNRQAYIYNQAGGASWKNVTPTYKVGTVSVTNGSPTVNSAGGTTFFASGVTAFNHILIAGTWYQICAVNSDTQLTLRTNYAGTTAAGLAYTIQRTWDTPNDSGLNRIELNNLIYCVLFNQTLYIAGNFVGGSANGALEPAVVRVANIFSATPTATYILGRGATNPGMDNLSTLREITGIQCLQDGRVIVSGCTDASEGVIFYSSNLADNVWSAPPGGSTVIVAKSGPIYALGKLGSDLTIHYRDGIVLGIPTGFADPPLAFQNTGATVGCYMPRTLKAVGGVEVFMSDDANVFTFDKTRTLAVGNEIRVLVTGPASYLRTSLHAGVNHRWNEYAIYQPIFTSAGGSSVNTKGFTLQIESGAWWQTNFPVPIGAVDDATPTTADYAVLGVYSNDNGTIRNMVWALSSTATSDALSFAGASIPTHILETEDLDFGAAMSYKTADSVVVWVRAFPIAGGVNLAVWVSRDGGGTWVQSATKSVPALLTGEVPIQFSFRDAIGAGPLLRYRLVMGTPANLGLIPTRLLIEADIGGDIGTVQL